MGWDGRKRKTARKGGGSEGRRPFMIGHMEEKKNPEVGLGQKI